MDRLQTYRVGYVRKKGVVRHAFIALPSGIVLHNTPRHHIKLTTVNGAATGRNITWTQKTGQAMSDIELVSRAKYLASHRSYSAWGYNCEHFVEELLGNKVRSAQRTKWLAFGGAAVLLAALI